MTDLWMAAVERATEKLRCKRCGGPVTVDRVLRWRAASWVCHPCAWAIHTWDPSGFFREYGHE